MGSFRLNTKFAAALGILFLTLSIFVLGTFFSIVNGHKNNFFDKSTEYSQARAKASALVNLEKVFEDSKDERESLMRRFPNDDDVINTILPLVEGIIHGQGATISGSNSLAERSIDDRFETLVITTNIEGTYTQIINIISLLEALPYQVVVGNVHLERSGESAGGVWKTGMEIRITKRK